MSKNPKGNKSDKVEPTPTGPQETVQATPSDKSGAKDNDRTPTGPQESVHKMGEKDRHRLAIGNRLRMDISHYLSLPEYQGKTLFWATSRNGDVEKWLALGAVPVKKVGEAAKIYKGINDRKTDEYEIAHSVSVVDGVPEDNYLLSLPNEVYHELRIAPHEQRNKEVREAMGIGKPEEDAVTMPHVKGLKTYAPSVGDGKRGLSTMQAGELTHDV